MFWDLNCIPTIEVVIIPQRRVLLPGTVYFDEIRHVLDITVVYRELTKRET